MKIKKNRGIWLFGLSGVGKSYASKLVFRKKSKSIIIDGDIVRKYVSNDLDYSLNARNIQIMRMLGLAKIAIESDLYPIISSVWMNQNTAKKIRKEKIQLIKIESNMDEIFKSHITYKNKKNVVGKDIHYENFKFLNIINSRNSEFWKELKKLI